MQLNTTELLCQFVPWNTQASCGTLDSLQVGTGKESCVCRKGVTRVQGCSTVISDA